MSRLIPAGYQISDPASVALFQESLIRASWETSDRLRRNEYEQLCTVEYAQMGHCESNSGSEFSICTDASIVISSHKNWSSKGGRVSSK